MDFAIDTLCSKGTMQNFTSVAIGRAALKVYNKVLVVKNGASGSLFPRRRIYHKKSTDLLCNTVLYKRSVKKFDPQCFAFFKTEAQRPAKEFVVEE